MLLQIKDAKIPFYEKLPKDNQFFKHYMQNIKFQRMKDVVGTKAEEDRARFDGAREKILEDMQRTSFNSPGNKKRMMYEWL